MFKFNDQICVQFGMQDEQRNVDVLQVRCNEQHSTAPEMLMKLVVEERYPSG